MYARSEPPRHQRRLAVGRGNLASQPETDHRDGKISTQCVNEFQSFILSELVLRYTVERKDLNGYFHVYKQECR